jgi:macrolide transport system ATP-binding/permease protein
MTAPLLRLRQIGRTYATGGAEVRALHGVDLDVYENDFVAIVGPSGGGKSTLLSVIGLLDAPTGGQYLIGGRDTASLTDAEITALRARTFGFVFQAFHLLDRRAVRDSAELGVLYKGHSPLERRRAADAALSAVGLSSRGDSLAGSLSGGQRQRVAIARALATGNPVLLADEPTGNLDTANGRAVLRVLRRLHAAGATIIVVTHSPEVAATASRVVRISDGRIVEDSRSEPPTAHAPAQDGPPGSPAGGASQRFPDVIRDAYASWTSHARDAVARIAAVAIAIALTVVTLGLGSSAAAQVTSSFDARANREVTVHWSHDRLPLRVAVDRARAVSGVDTVAALSDLGEVDITAHGETRSTTLHGSHGDLEQSTGSRIRWARADGHALHRGQVLIGASLASQLGLAPLSASPSVTLRGRPFVVVGTLEESRRFPRLPGELILTEADADQLASPGHSTLAIVTSQAAAQQVGAQISVALDAFQPEQYVVDVPIDPQTLRQEVEGGVQAALVAFTVLASVAAVFTLSSSISASVYARRSEFGLRRAVGARARDLALLVTTESAMLGLIGGVGGLALGVVSILVFTMVQRWLPVFDWRLAPLALAAGIALAMLSSVAGARHAARARPADALRA